MATSTPYLNLVKPAYSETADIGVLNENADKIDQAVSGQAQAIAGKPDDATEMPLGPNDTILVSQAITNLQNEIGIVCTGNTCAISASTGQYVVLKNSTISGRTDGLYTAAKTIPANTVIDSTYLTAVPSGGMNDLKGQVDSLNSKFMNTISTLSDLNNVIQNMASGERRLLLFAGAVSNSLANFNAASIAITTKMDGTGTADIFLFSLSGNYVGTIRYLMSTSSIAKENKLLLNNDIVVETVTSGTIEIAANDRGVFSIDVSKSGYTPIGIIGLNLSNNWMYVGGFSITGTNAQVVIHNGMNRSTANETVYLTVLYKRT